MQAIRSILVVIEPDQLEGLALKRAQLIAGVTQSHLHLLVCEKRRDHSAALNDLAQELREEGYSVSTNQAWKDSLHQTIIAEQQAEGCGLIIKQHFPDNPLKKAILTPDDWKLLRFAPCPVLMTKTARPWTGGKILAAVDVGNNDGEHRSLHAGIISHAYDIAGLAKATLHVISAHPSPMLSSADPTFQLSETIEARYREACRTFQAEYGFSDEQLHIEEGPADVLIPRTAQKLDAVVTVIGTVARTGLSGALIGNTAEVVLDTLESDVLVLVRQAPVAEFRQQCHAVGFDLVDQPGTAGDQLVGPAIGRLLGDEADLPLLQLQAQARGVEDFQLGGHHLGQQLLKATPDSSLFLGVVEVPVDHLMVETLAATAYQVAVYRGAKPYAGGFDSLRRHGRDNENKAAS